MTAGFNQEENLPALQLTAELMSLKNARFRKEI
jgi:hypothetical protein